MSKNYVQDEVVHLINRKVDLQTLEKRIETLKEHFINIDPKLVSDLNQKLEQGKEDQQSVNQVISALQENDLSGKDIDKISELIHKAKATNIDFPELKQLVSVKFIPQWIKKLCGIILPKKVQQQNVQKKSILELSKDLIHYVDQIDPISLSKKLKQQLKENIEQGKAPQILDRTLSELFLKIKVIIWIKEVFDLLGKDRFQSSEIDQLKELDIDSQKVENYKQLKYKYTNFKEHIDTIYEAKNKWLDDSEAVIKSFDDLDIDSYDTNKGNSSLKTKVEEQMEKISEKIEKVQEVKETYYKLQKVQEQLTWVEKIQSMVINNEKKSMVELQILYKKALDLGINEKQWRIYEGFQEIYNITQNISLSTEQIRKYRDIIKETKFDKKLPFHEFFLQNMQKISYKDAVEIHDQIDLLVDKINLKEELKDIQEDLQKCTQFEEHVEELVKKYNGLLQNNNGEMKQEQLDLVIEDIQKLNEELFSIPIYLENAQQEVFGFQWSIQCVYNIMGFGKQNIEKWSQLIIATKYLKTPNETLLSKVTGEISIYQKIEMAFKELKSKEKLKEQERIDGAKDLRTLKEVKDLQKAIEQLLIDSESIKLYINNIVSIAEEKITKFNELYNSKERQSSKAYKELLTEIRSSLPFSLEEEFQIDDILKEGQKIKNLIKKMGDNKEKQEEMAKRYILQKVHFKEGEKISKEIKLKEDTFGRIQKEIQNFLRGESKNTINMEKHAEFTKEIESFKESIEEKKIEKITNDLYVVKIFILEYLWDNQEEVDITSKQIYELFKETDQKLKKLQTICEVEQDIEVEEENQYNQFYKQNLEKCSNFLKGIVQNCDKKLKQIKSIQNIKQLENIIKKEDNCFCGFVNLKEEINAIQEELVQTLKREKELERQMENSLSESEKIYNTEDDYEEKQQKEKKKAKKSKKEVEKPKKSKSTTSNIEKKSSSSSQNTKSNLLQRMEEKTGIKIKKEEYKKRPKISLGLQDSVEESSSYDDSSEEDDDDEYQQQQQKQRLSRKMKDKLESKGLLKKKPTDSSNIELKMQERRLKKEMELLKLKQKEREKQEILKYEESREKLKQKEKVAKLKLKLQQMKEKELLEQRRKEEEKRLKLEQIQKIKNKKKKEELKYQQTKKKLIGDISNSISNVEIYDFSIDESINEAKRFFKQIELMHGPREIEKFTKTANDIVRTFNHIQFYENICLQLKQNKFDWKYLFALLNKNDQQLEQEDKKLQMSFQLEKQQQYTIPSARIKKKSSNNEQNQQQQQPQGNMYRQQQQQQQQNSKNDRYQISNTEGLDLRRSQLIAKKSIQKIQSRKSATKNFGNYANNNSQIKQQRRGPQFSDDEEEDPNQYKSKFNYYDGVLNEEEYEQMKQIYRQEELRYNEKLASKPLLYNPDQSQQNQQQQQDQYLQQEDNMQEQQVNNNLDMSMESVGDCSYQISTINFNTDEFFFESVRVMSMHCLEELKRLPTPTDQTLLEGIRISDVQVEEHFHQLFQQQEINRKDMVFTAGWLENMNSEQHEALNQYALNLLNDKSMVIVSWGMECKLYLLHQAQIPEQWFEQANFSESSQMSQPCHLYFFCAFKPYRIQDKNYKKNFITTIQTAPQQQQQQQQDKFNDTDIESIELDQPQTQLQMLANPQQHQDILEQEAQKIQDIKENTYKNRYQQRMDNITRRQLQKSFGNPNKPNYGSYMQRQNRFNNNNKFKKQQQYQQQQQQYQEDSQEDLEFQNQQEMQSQLQQQFKKRAYKKKIRQNNNINNSQSMINIQEDYMQDEDMEQQQQFNDDENQSFDENNIYTQQQQEMTNQQQLQQLDSEEELQQPQQQILEPQQFMHHQSRQNQINQKRKFRDFNSGKKNKNNQYEPHGKKFGKFSTYKGGKKGLKNNLNNNNNNNIFKGNKFQEQQFLKQQQQIEKLTQQVQLQTQFLQEQQLLDEQQQQFDNSQEQQQYSMHPGRQVSSLRDVYKTSAKQGLSNKKRQSRFSDSKNDSIKQYQEQQNFNNQKQKMPIKNNQQQQLNQNEFEQQYQQQQQYPSNNETEEQQQQFTYKSHTDRNNISMQEQASNSVQNPYISEEYKQQRNESVERELQQQQIIQQQQIKTNSTFLRTRDSSLDSTTSNKSRNILPISLNNFNGSQINEELNNSKLKRSFLEEKEMQSSMVNPERLKQLRI